MTLTDIINTDKVCLTPADIAPILGCDPQAIRSQAQNDPRKLGFNIIITGKRIRIPRIPFLQYLGYY